MFLIGFFESICSAGRFLNWLEVFGRDASIGIKMSIFLCVAKRFLAARLTSAGIVSAQDLIWLR